MLLDSAVIDNQQTLHQQGIHTAANSVMRVYPIKKYINKDTNMNYSYKLQVRGVA